MPAVDVEGVRVPLAGADQSRKGCPVELGDEFANGIMQVNVGDPIVGRGVARLPEKAQSLPLG